MTAKSIEDLVDGIPRVIIDADGVAHIAWIVSVHYVAPMCHAWSDVPDLSHVEAAVPGGPTCVLCAAGWARL